MIRTLKALYITSLIVIIILIALLIGSFIFLEKTTHKEYSYDVRINDMLMGNIRIDRFATEDRLIYKAASSMPLDPLFIESKTKMVLNKNYTLENYLDERSTRNGIASITSIEVTGNTASFLSRFQSDIIYIDDLPIRKDVFVFREDSPLTYIPIIENYDFRKGRSQGFYALTSFEPFLPPVRRYVTFTSIRDEYLKIDGRKIKAENLILKIKNYPQCSVWVAKSDRKLLMIELPSMNMKITRSFRHRAINPTEPPTATGPFKKRDVAFKNKNTQLAGTLTTPEGDGKYPAILFIPGKGPYTRDYAGFFESAANYFAKNGFSSLIIDKRGTGKSSGDANWPTRNDEVDDINAALGFLASQPEVEPANISILAHGEGVIAAARAANDNKNIRSIVFMAPALYSIVDYDEKPDLLNAAAEKKRWAASYKTLVLKASRDTKDKVRNSKFNWAYILRKRCYLGEMKDRLEKDPVDPIKKISIPVLTVQGNDDTQVVVESAAQIDKALKSAGNNDSSIIYYGYLGHFLGQPLIDGIHPVRYEASTEVMYAILNWIRGRLTVIETPSPEETLPQHAQGGNI